MTTSATCCGTCSSDCGNLSNGANLLAGEQSFSLAPNAMPEIEQAGRPGWLNLFFESAPGLVVVAYALGTLVGMAHRLKVDDPYRQSQGSAHTVEIKPTQFAAPAQFVTLDNARSPRNDTPYLGTVPKVK